MKLHQSTLKKVAISANILNLPIQGTLKVQSKCMKYMGFLHKDF